MRRLFHGFIIPAFIGAMALVTLPLHAEDVTTASAQTPAPVSITPEAEARGLADQVDMLRLINALGLKESQMTMILGKIEALKQKWDDGKKKEDAILLSAKEPLQKIHDALAAGKPSPADAEALVAPKRKSLSELRGSIGQMIDNAVNDCVANLTDGQLRLIARTPEAVAYASKLVNRIRMSSDDAWPQTMADVSAELLRVRQYDMQAGWESRLQGLKGEERDRAVKDLESQSEPQVADMKVQIEQMLTTIRGANQMAVPIGVDKLAVAVRSQTDVRDDAFNIMNRIIDNTGSVGALKARIAGLQAEAAKPQPGRK